MKNLSVPKGEQSTAPLFDSLANEQQSEWDAYSIIHDSFTELLAYESRKKFRSDIWQLHYI